MILNAVSSATPQVSPQVTPQVKALIEVISGEMSRDELQTALDLKDRKSFRELYLKPALEEGLVEMTIPDKPNSRNQKYRLTEKGRIAVGISLDHGGAYASEQLLQGIHIHLAGVGFAPKIFSHGDFCKKFRCGLVLLGAIIVAGVLFSRWLAVQVEIEMRANLLNHARMVAEALDINNIEGLSGSESDLRTPEYLRLKEQFSAVHSEPLGSEDESPAGQVYEEVPEAYLRVFKTKTAVVEGPVNDRWGAWVSALIPLVDPHTNKLIAVLGMDVDARDWKREVAVRAMLPVGLTVLALVSILAASSALLARRISPIGYVSRWMKHIEVAMTVATGLVLTLFAAWLAESQYEYNQ
ncbi:hypothetical protein ADUPG1_003322, partial [Aduncisulcus paluster]